MQASQIKIASLVTWSDCQDAIDAIERDYRNVVGGLKAWYSGRTTELTAAAQKKIAAIEAKQATFDDGEDE